MSSPLQLRPYQQECLAAMQNYDGRAALCLLATGLGKTVIFSEYIRQEVKNEHRCLILSHRDELVRQPLRYLDDIPCGIEIGSTRSRGQMLVSASVQSIVNRLHRFNHREFDTIIVDEAHHAAAPTYRKILDYFDGAQVFGFTATANRGDGIGLSCVFEKILFERDLHWGIENNYLSELECKQVRLKYSMESVKIVNGDFSPSGIAKAMSGTAVGIAEIYTKYARGQTIIFAASVPEAKEITANINDTYGDIARLICSGTPNRDLLLSGFAIGKYRVLVNFGVLTEGVDTKNAETILIARPVAHTNVGLYAQMVGRGMRLYPGKEKCLVIDCIGISHSPICTAATLIGKELQQNTNVISTSHRASEKPLVVLSGDKIPDTWVRSSKNVDIMKKKQGVNTHNVNYFELSDGSRILECPAITFIIQPPDPTNNQVHILRNGKKSNNTGTLQQAFDYIYGYLKEYHADISHIWDLEYFQKWSNKRITAGQIKIIKELAPSYKLDIANTSRGMASQYIQFLRHEVPLIRKREEEKNAQTG